MLKSESSSSQSSTLPAEAKYSPSSLSRYEIALSGSSVISGLMADAASLSSCRGGHVIVGREGGGMGEGGGREDWEGTRKGGREGTRKGGREGTRE